MYDFYNPPKIVVSESTPGAGEALLGLYAGIEAPVIRTNIRVAEMAKYCDDAFHALKVSFANEVGNLCKKMGVDSHDVMAVVCDDRKLNLSPAYLKPGFAFGGSCLPKDLRALAYEAKCSGLDRLVLNTILESNAVQIQLSIPMVTTLGRKRVGYLGTAFKPDTDDMRESPPVEVIETLLGRGSPIRIYACNVPTSRLIGANRRFIEEHIPHLSSLLVDDANDLVAQPDVIVVGYQSPEFASVVEILRANQTVIDLERLATRVPIRTRHEGICG